MVVMRRPLFSRRKRETPHAMEGAQQRQQHQDDDFRSRVASLPEENQSAASDDNMTMFRVNVPDHIRPGEYFQVYAGGRVIRVQCPFSYKRGQHLQVSLPNTDSQTTMGHSTSRSSIAAEKRYPSLSLHHDEEHDSNEYPGSSSQSYHPKHHQRHASAGTRRTSFEYGHERQHHGRSQSFSDRKPPSVSRLDHHPVEYPDQHQRYGRSPTIQSPPSQSDHHSQRHDYFDDNPHHHHHHQQHPTGRRGHDRQASRRLSSRHASSTSSSSHHDVDDDESSDSQLFEVEVPEGAQPGAPFALMANGVRVLVNCPPEAKPGQLIQFNVPRELYSQQQQKVVEGPAAIRLEYDKDGWTRRIRVSDMKFQWIRVDQQGEVDVHLQRFNVRHSAYVRKLTFRKGTDVRFRQGNVGLVPASEGVTDSRVRGKDGRQLVSYSDIARAQVKPFAEKAEWFHDTCTALSVAWNEGHMRINVRRKYLLGDSVDAIMSLSRKDMRKLWRFEFVGEEAIDAGGLTREWFYLVTKQIFDPDMGLWQSSAANQMGMQINPSSGLCCEDHLEFFRFLGRIMGKALFDQQLCAGHMVQHMYKHLLAWPVTFADLETADAEYYNNLKQLETLVESGQDLSMLCLDFTTGQEIFGTQEQVDLVKGGSNIGLTNDNFPEYLEACLKYKLLDVVKPQLTQLLLGFFDIIPEPLLTVFDFQELELLMCGLPKIDMTDWKSHTEYLGVYSASHPVCRWFWEVVEGFNQEMKARLLQFVTGTSGVPSRGFAVLQGNDGDIRKFTIKSVPVGDCLYPRAHTCFNRLDLPMYGSKEELEQKLKLAVTMCATGFDIE